MSAVAGKLRSISFLFCAMLIVGGLWIAADNQSIGSEDHNGLPTLHVDPALMRRGLEAAIHPEAGRMSEARADQESGDSTIAVGITPDDDDPAISPGITSAGLAPAQSDSSDVRS